MEKQKEKPFWETNINPITGWKVDVFDERSRAKKERQRLKLLKSYGNNG